MNRDCEATPPVERTETTDSDGRFEFSDVPEGSCALQVSRFLHDDLRREQVQVNGPTEVNLDLEN